MRDEITDIPDVTPSRISIKNLAKNPAVEQALSLRVLQNIAYQHSQVSPKPRRRPRQRERRQTDERTLLQNSE